jgi:Protein of unknown function (DUF4038)/Putative collagen-binding domain of a collagenase
MTGLRSRCMTWLAVLAVLLIVGVSGSWMLWRHFHQGSPGQRMKIPGTASGSPLSRPAHPANTARPEGLPFVTSVSPDHRYFLDQYGAPILVKGDAPWTLMTRLSPQQAQLWFSDRRRQGFNAAIVSLIGAVTNGAPSDDGATFDGLLPFVNGDVLQWQEPYWERVTAYLRLAADHGITVMLYPIDGWTIGRSFVPKSLEQCSRYGTKVAQRFRDLPNIVWMSGGDYASAGEDPARGSDVDHCIAAMMSAIRETGDNRPFSMQFESQSFSTQNPYWAQRVDWNFVYTYHPTYQLVLDAYRTQPAIPAVLGEANYEGENNHPGTPDTTNETLRRQVLWALTSGAAGDFFGSHDWEFNDGWEERLSTRAVTQIASLRTLFSTLAWWRLVPDVDGELVTAGRGTELTTDENKAVLQNDFVTAARTPDGRLAVIYVPTQQTIAVNTSAMADGTRAVWIDPASGDRRPAPMSNSFTTPGTNADGDEDWLLILTS